MKTALKILKWLGIGLISLAFILFMVYILGPRPQMESIDNQPKALSTKSLTEIEAEIAEKEAALEIKEDNQSQIIWFDSIPQQTEYSLVYLHGFSASQGEATPLHKELAQKHGMNLYLPRLAKHGLKSRDAMGELTPKLLVESAKNAVAVGKKLGKKVILMSCSTGSSLSLYLAAEDPEIAGIIALSPNIAIADPNAKLLAGPWGKKIVRTVYGGEYTPDNCATEGGKKYWSCSYHVDALIALQLFIKSTMHPEIFKKVKQPFFMGYYYKDEEHQDQTVSVAAMLEMYEELGTPEDLKRKTAFPEAATHVVASQWHSKSLEEVNSAVFAFAEEVLKLP
jgi:esterase/lipase